MFIWIRQKSAVFHRKSALFRNFQVMNIAESQLKHFWIRADQRCCLRCQPEMVTSGYHDLMVFARRVPNLRKNTFLARFFRTLWPLHLTLQLFRRGLFTETWTIWTSVRSLRVNFQMQKLVNNVLINKFKLKLKSFLNFNCKLVDKKRCSLAFHFDVLNEADLDQNLNCRKKWKLFPYTWNFHQKRN